MIVLNLKAKVCMSHLLLKPTFDTFSLIEGEVTTFNRFQVESIKTFLMKLLKRSIPPGEKCAIFSSR